MRGSESMSTHSIMMDGSVHTFVHVMAFSVRTSFVADSPWPTVHLSCFWDLFIILISRLLQAQAIEWIQSHGVYPLPR